MRYFSIFSQATLVGSLALSLGACSSDPKADDPVASDDDDDAGDDDDAADDDDDAGGDDDDGPGDDDDDTGTGDGGNSCTPGVGDCPDGQKCQPYVKEDGSPTVDAAQCVAIIGTKQHGEPCTRERYQDDCDKDVFCMLGTTGKEGEGTCYQLCDGSDPDSCIDKGLAGSVCNSYNDGILPICDTACDPIRPSACIDADGCYPFGTSFWCIPPDPEPGKGNYADDCNTVQSCNPGLYCHNPGSDVPGCESDRCCTRFCDLEGDGTECMEPATCVAFFAEDSDADPGLIESVGSCIIEDGG